MTADEDLEMDLEKEMKKQLARNPRFFSYHLGFLWIGGFVALFTGAVHDDCYLANLRCAMFGSLPWRLC